MINHNPAVNLLAIETSGDFCSLAVSRGDAVHARHIPAGQRHAEIALDAIDALLSEAGMKVADLQGIAYGEGPGSFTGLRIACSLVQGLAFARGLPAAGGGHAHAGAMIYLGGDNWPAEYRNSILMNNIHGFRANTDRLERK